MPDDSVDLIPIYAAQNIIIVHVEVQAVYNKILDAQSLIVYELHLADAPDTPECHVRRDGFEMKFDTGAGVKRNAATAGIEDKIERIRIIIKQRLYHDHATSKTHKRETTDQAGRRRYEFFLSS